MFADLVPKTLAAKYSVPVVLNMAYPAYAAQQMLKPIMFFVVPLIYKLTGGKGLNVPFVTEEELKIMLDQSSKSGAIEAQEVKMIKNVFQLKDITAEDCMTPRIYVLARLQPHLRGRKNFCSSRSTPASRSMKARWKHRGDIVQNEGVDVVSAGTYGNEAP